MKQKPRWTLEMLTASLAVLCGLLVLVLLIQRPTAWPALLALVVLWGVVVVLFRCQLRKWVARWMCGGSFEGSKLKFSLEPLSQPAALLSGDTDARVPPGIKRCGTASGTDFRMRSALDRWIRR